MLNIEPLQKALDELAAAIKRLSDDIAAPPRILVKEPGIVAVHPGPKEKAPASSEVEPVCSLCSKTYDKCFCLPF